MDAIKQSRKQATDRLDHRARVVLDALASHICVIDPDGVIVEVNRAWEQFASANGSPAGEFGLGQNYIDVCGEDTAPDDEHPASTTATATIAARGIRDVLNGKVPNFELEYPCHAPNQDRWFLMTATPLVELTDSSRPSPMGAVISHFDITDRKRHERELRDRAIDLAELARALKRSNEDLDQFAYVTSHDLKAPLRGIANLSRWIEEDMGAAFTPEAHEQMNLLRGRVARMEAMIDGLLQYSRVGRAKIKPERINVGQLLVEVVDLLAPPAAITITIDPNMPVILTERLPLQQVFLNLVGNAIKHGRPDGTIAVGCRDTDRPGWVEFFVRDNGPGIDPLYHEKIFVIFQTLQPRDKVEGTGIGLSLVRRVVEGRGGIVRVESREGQGSTFYFTWPNEPAGLLKNETP